jgi:hypothetical protein
MLKGAKAMSQISFADAEYAGKRKKTRREVFLGIGSTHKNKRPEAFASGRLPSVFHQR